MPSRGDILLIAYDIRHPRRLRQIHGWLKKRALPVQKSVFLGYFSGPGRAELTGGLHARMHERRDDVRVYVLAEDAMPDVLGRTLLPEGLHWLPEQAAAISLLHHSALESARRYPSAPLRPPPPEAIEQLLAHFVEAGLARLARYLAGGPRRRR